VRRGKSENRIAQRARIVLLAWESKGISEISRIVALSRNIVRKWIERFRRSGIDWLYDAVRSGRPPVYMPSQRLRVIEVACQNPADFGLFETRWSLSLLSDILRRRRLVPKISRATVQRILKKGAIKPHLHRMWVNSHDPNFDQKADAILKLYLQVYKSETVLCYDEKPGIQANERFYPSHPVRPGKPERVEFHYKRHGTVDLLAFFDVRTGKVIGRCEKRHTQFEFLKMLDLAIKAYPRGRIHIVLDNASSHFTDNVKAWLKKHPRVRLYFTPTHASWLNQVEIWFSILSRQLLRRGSFSSKEDLKRRIAGYIKQWNRSAHAFRWTYTGEPLAA
jgi:transposase